MPGANFSDILLEGTDTDFLSLQIYFNTILTEEFRLRGLLSSAIMGGDADNGISSQVMDVRPIVNSTSARFNFLGEGQKTTPVRAGEPTGSQARTVTSGEVRLFPRRKAEVVLSTDQLRSTPIEHISAFMSQLSQDVREYAELASFITLAKAARTAARFKDGRRVYTGGKRVTVVAADVATAYPSTPTGAEAFVDKLAELGVQFTEAKNTNPRFAFVLPYISERVLPQKKELVDKDLNAEMNGSLSRLKVTWAANHMIIPTSGHLPDRVVGVNDDLLGEEIPSLLHGNFTNAAGHGLPVALTVAPDPVRRPIAVAVADGSSALIVPRREQHALYLQASSFWGMAVYHPYVAGEIANVVA